MRHNIFVGQMLVQCSSMEVNLKARVGGVNVSPFGCLGAVKERDILSGSGVGDRYARGRSPRVKAFLNMWQTRKTRI